MAYFLKGLLVSLRHAVPQKTSDLSTNQQGIESSMSAIKDRPILFSAPMVRAILNGRKTQTRRVAKIARIDQHPQNADLQVVTFENGKQAWMNSQSDHPYFVNMQCPHGLPGDLLWVRETWAHDAASVEQCRASREDAMGRCVYGPYYRATDGAPDTLRWIPSIHMPRWASRINLGITSVRVERLQDISRGDCMAEGCPFPNMAESDPKKWYADLWDSINGDGAWDKNPWVWVVEFKRVAA